jgi:hypothetical protein
MNSGGKERMDDSGDEDLPSFGLIASLAVDEGEIDRVLKVFPNQGLSREKIRQDLRRSGSAGATINRILDNQVEPDGWLFLLLTNLTSRFLGKRLEM